MERHSDIMIDILLATYNGQKYLAEQMDSILAQTNQNWRLLVRDDGSSDGTVKIIEQHVARYPLRIKQVSDNCGHLGLALNFGRLLECAEADYFMFSDQDDIWLPNKIELTLNAMKAAEESYPDKPVLVHTDLKVVNSDLETIADSFWAFNKISPAAGSSLKRIIQRNVVTGCTLMINRKARQVSIPIPKEARIHDWWLALNVARYGKIVYISVPTVLYRQHENSAIGARKLEPMTLGIFLRKLRSWRKQLSNDYKVIKKVDPSICYLPLLLNSIGSAITRRLI